MTVSEMLLVQLSVDDWNKVLAILAQAPWQTVNPLIMQIGEQLRAQPGTQASAPGNSDGREKVEH
jgi:hypothetical protein